MLQSPTEPFGCLRLAREYFKAARQVQRPAASAIDALRQDISFPAYFLVGHAIELSLKAYLLGRGMTINVLRSRKFGHNLESLLTEARRHKLGRFVKLSKFELDAIRILNQCYSAKDFEYAATGICRLPQYAGICATADRLTGGLRNYCIMLAASASVEVKPNSLPPARSRDIEC